MLSQNGGVSTSADSEDQGAVGGTQTNVSHEQIRVSGVNTPFKINFEKDLTKTPGLNPNYVNLIRGIRRTEGNITSDHLQVFSGLGQNAIANLDFSINDQFVQMDDGYYIVGDPNLITGTLPPDTTVLSAQITNAQTDGTLVHTGSVNTPSLLADTMLEESRVQRDLEHQQLLSNVQDQINIQNTKPNGRDVRPKTPWGGGKVPINTPGPRPTPKVSQTKKQNLTQSSIQLEQERISASGSYTENMGNPQGVKFSRDAFQIENENECFQNDDFENIEYIEQLSPNRQGDNYSNENRRQDLADMNIRPENLSRRDTGRGRCASTPGRGRGRGRGRRQQQFYDDNDYHDERRGRGRGRRQRFYDDDDYYDEDYRIERTQRAIRSMPRSLNFDGTGDWYVFKNKFLHFVTTFNLSDTDSLSCLIYCLLGSAGQLFAALNESHHGVSFDDLLIKLDQTYGNMQTESMCQREFESTFQKKEETLQQWADRVQRLGCYAFKSLCNPVFEQSKIVDRFCAGLLNARLGYEITIQRPRTLPEALQLAFMADNAYKTICRRDRNRPSFPQARYAASHDYEDETSYDYYDDENGEDEFDGDVEYGVRAVNKTPQNYRRGGGRNGNNPRNGNGNYRRNNDSQNSIERELLLQIVESINKGLNLSPRPAASAAKSQTQKLSDTPQNSDGQPRCFRCGDLQHFIKDCPKNETSNK
jgi:hypothetical protein